MIHISDINKRRAKVYSGRGKGEIEVMHRNPIRSADETRVDTARRLVELAQLNDDPGDLELDGLRASVEAFICADQTYFGPAGAVRVEGVGRDILLDGPGSIFVAFRTMAVSEAENEETKRLPFLTFFETYVLTYLE